MSDIPDDLDLARSLRDGLRALPVPEIGSDFDARVLDALRAPPPWWRQWWQPAKPLLLGASCSLSVTLVLLHWTLAAPHPHPNKTPILWGPDEGGGRVQASGRGRTLSVESLLDRPGLRAGSLAAAWAIAPPPDRRPAPPRHAQSGRRAPLA